MRPKVFFAGLLVLSALLLFFIPEVLALIIITGIAIKFVFTRSSSNEEL